MKITIEHESGETVQFEGDAIIMSILVEEGVDIICPMGGTGHDEFLEETLNRLEEIAEGNLVMDDGDPLFENEEE